MLWPLIAPLIAVQLILMCVALVSLTRSERANGPKWLWAIIIVLLKYPGDDLARSRRPLLAFGSAP